MFGILGWIGLILISLWVYQDAEKRGFVGWKWALGTFLLVIVVLPFYLLVRDMD